MTSSTRLVDTAGNSDTWTEDFEVLARSAYKVNLRPGWNLISVPADPADPAIGTLSSRTTTRLRPVLSYQNGEWVTATRDAETGAWVRHADRH